LKSGRGGSQAGLFEELLSVENILSSMKQNLDSMQITSSDRESTLRESTAKIEEQQVRVIPTKYVDLSFHVNDSFFFLLKKTKQKQMGDLECRGKAKS
jgi:hypothetical protein